MDQSNTADEYKIQNFAINKETDESLTQSLGNLAQSQARLPYKELLEKICSRNILPEKNLSSNNVFIQI
jgi:hypothetical protein